jgi:hypothetical protein
MSTMSVRVVHARLHILVIHCFQTDDGEEGDEYGIAFGDGFDLIFWYNKNYALGQRINGYTTVTGDSFAQPAEGPHALNNGEEDSFVFTAFQVLLVRPTEGLCLCADIGFVDSYSLFHDDYVGNADPAFEFPSIPLIV